MVDVGGGIILAVVALFVGMVVVRVIATGWSQWRCVLLGHRWARPADDRDYGTSYRSTGMLSWHVRSRPGSTDLLFTPQSQQP